MPKGHPARDDFETFFIDFPENQKYGKMVLSPHTSSGQNREMRRTKPPIRMINIAKTYRPNWDTTHTPMFHQFEGLCIDKDINITHLKGTIDYFVKQFFGKERTIRLRPAHFQFTEPSFEIDVSCGICGGKGEIEGKKCRVCKSGWLELAGAGMVHPNVLRMGEIDPKQYSGWAFGFGPERCMMMREEMKIDDIRILYNGDIRFLEQF
jgi:phenylalanyl-tRNA synthetase alpha chain